MKFLVCIQIYLLIWCIQFNMSLIFDYTNNVKSILQTKSIPFVEINYDKLKETANSQQYNENKLLGTIARNFINNTCLIICNPSNYITKKGGNLILSAIKRRTNLSDCPILCVSYSDEINANENIIKGVKVNNWYAKSNISINNIDDIVKFALTKSVNVGALDNLVNITCGLETSTSTIFGHMTFAFGINTNIEEILYQKLSPLIGMVFEGIVLPMVTSKDGKNFTNGGSVIYLEEMDKIVSSYINDIPDITKINTDNMHITCNSTIKAVLSRQIVGQYKANIMEFMLSDIDKTTKQDIYIKILAPTSTSVKITNWYSYLIDSH